MFNFFNKNIKKSISGTVKIPGSKSITNRALVIASLSDGKTFLENVLFSEDTKVMIKCLRKLGIKIKIKKKEVEIIGVGGLLKSNKKTFFVGESGTTARFLTSLLCLGEGGEYTVCGGKRMSERPILGLIDILNEQGSVIKNIDKKIGLPITITPGGFSGGDITVGTSESSQFVSSLLLISPYAKKDVCITLEGERVSMPYIEMTIDIMKSFGVKCDFIGKKKIFVKANQKYKVREYKIESDASSASYFFGIAAVCFGKISVSSFLKKSHQGDLKFLDILKQMGCRVTVDNDTITVLGKELNGVEVNMKDCSDVVMTLSVVALFANGKTKITGISNIRLKESDRLLSMYTELKKIGADVEMTNDSLTIYGKKNYVGAKIDTYNDHRIAMAFSIALLKIKNIKIQNPKCVAKTFPNYWKKFYSLVK